jgi:hypothetical protein
MYYMMSIVSNKALILFTLLSNKQAAADPLIEQLNNTDLFSSQVTTMESEVVVQLTQQL